MVASILWTNQVCPTARHEHISKPFWLKQKLTKVVPDSRVIRGTIPLPGCTFEGGVDGRYRIWRSSANVYE